MTYDEMIAVIQAAKDGKVIQMLDGGVWGDYPGQPAFDSAPIHQYRVKPEPKVLFRHEKGVCVVRAADGKVYFANVYRGGYWLHVVGHDNPVHYPYPVTELTRAQCEAAGFEYIAEGE
jgi:hypothetical protein